MLLLSHKTFKRPVLLVFWLSLLFIILYPRPEGHGNCSLVIIGFSACDRIKSGIGKYKICCKTRWLKLPLPLGRGLYKSSGVGFSQILEMMCKACYLLFFIHDLKAAAIAARI